MKQEPRLVTGADVRAWLAQSGVTQTQLAKHVNCSRQTVCNWLKPQAAHQPLREPFQECVSDLINAQWQAEYREALRRFVKEATRSVILWNIMRNAGIDEEILIDPEFCLYCFEDRPIAFDEILQHWTSGSSQPKLIIGSSGMGKTTFVRLAVLRLLHLYGLSEPPALPLALPLVAPLGLFPFWHRATAPHERNLPSFLRYVFGSHGLFPDRVPEMVRLLKAGRAILFLDGIDEVSPELHHEFLMVLFDFIQAAGTSNQRIIITTRTLNFEIHDRLIRRCAVYDLKPFTHEQIIRLAHGLLPRAQATTFLQELRYNAGLEQLARTPLMLSVMLLMYRNGGVVQNSEGAVLDCFFEIVLGKYASTRSLGGTIERDRPFKYVNAPAAVRSTIFYMCDRLRRQEQFIHAFTIAHLDRTVREYWTNNKFVPDNTDALGSEAEALRLYLSQIGVILPTAPIARGPIAASTGVQFCSDIMMDWLAANHLVSHPDELQRELDQFPIGKIPLSPSLRRRLFYALEAISVNIPLSANDKIASLFDRLPPLDSNTPRTPDQFGTEPRLHSRSLFLVDCLRRGLVINYELKRRIRARFRRLVEENDYALIQKELQARLGVLDPGQEQDIQDERDYVNPFMLRKLPPEWSDARRRQWQQAIVQQRWDALPTDRRLVYSRRLEWFQDDISWRYVVDSGGLIESLRASRNEVPTARTAQQIRIRRQLFAARFVSLEQESPDSAQALLNELLEVARRYKTDPVLRYMALDSCWHLLERIKTLRRADQSHPISSMQLDSEYFAVAKEHRDFRARYCNGSDSWTLDDIIGDDDAPAHYMIVEARGVRSRIERSHQDSEGLRLNRELLEVDKEISKSRHLKEARLNRAAKICVYMSWFGSKWLREVTDVLIDLASSKGERQFYSVGPRQLYDYAVFALWSIYEFESTEQLDLLPF